MNAAAKKVLVIGGNGFIGSAICRAALAKGFDVTSVSSSGRPYRTPKGHSPAWTTKVNWQQGDAFEPQTFAHLLSETGSVVHTLGALLEGTAYKEAIKNKNVPALLGELLGIGKDANPLQGGVSGERQASYTSYERLNRDSALRVCEAFLASSPKAPSEIPARPRPFVYLSAEDIFRPVIPAGYIESKRDAEQRIELMMRDSPDYRGVYIRPSLVYHAHLRPLTTPIAALLDLSAAIHRKVPSTIPTPSSILRSLGSMVPQSAVHSLENQLSTSPLDSIANALTLPPIHVDHVAAAVVATLDATSDIRGVVGVHRMRELIGWTDDTPNPELVIRSV